MCHCCYHLTDIVYVLAIEPDQQLCKACIVQILSLTRRQS